MKRLLAAFIAAVVICSLAAGQDKPSAYSITFTKDRTGTAIYPDRGFDEVWSATIKALTVLKYRITASEKESGTISAIRQPTQFDTLVGGKADRAIWSLVVEICETGVQITTVAENIVSPKRAARHLCDKIAELLK